MAIQGAKLYLKECGEDAYDHLSFEQNAYHTHEAWVTNIAKIKPLEVSVTRSQLAQALLRVGEKAAFGDDMGIEEHTDAVCKELGL